MGEGTGRPCFAHSNFTCEWKRAALLALKFPQPVQDDRTQSLSRRNQKRDNTNCSGCRRRVTWQKTWMRAAGGGTTLFLLAELENQAVLWKIEVQPSHMIVTEYPYAEVGNQAIGQGQQSPDQPLPWVLWKSEDVQSWQFVHSHRVPRTQRAIADHLQAWLDSNEAELERESKVTLKLYAQADCRLARYYQQDQAEEWRCVALTANPSPIPIRRSFAKLTIPGRLDPTDNDLNILKAQLLKMLKAACTYCGTASTADLPLDDTGDWPTRD